MVQIDRPIMVSPKGPMPFPVHTRLVNALRHVHLLYDGKELHIKHACVDSIDRHIYIIFFEFVTNMHMLVNI